MKYWLRASQSYLGRGRVNPEAGYTITEVMIVLAVSAAMFTAIAFAFSGRQVRVEFNKSVRDFEAQMQNTINDVSAGFYQGFECTATDVPGVPPVVTDDRSDGGTGTSGSCVFLGKVVSIQGSRQESTISTLVGRRRAVPAGGDVQNLAEANPVIVPAANVNYSHPFRLEVYRIVDLTLGKGVVDSVGFINKLSGTNLSGGNNLINLYAFDSALQDVPQDGDRSSGGVVFCLRGQNNQRAKVEIGTENSQTSIFSELDIQTVAGDPCHG